MERRSRVETHQVSRLTGKKVGSWLTSEDRRFREMWADGTPVWKIAKELNRTTSSVSGRRQWLELPPRRRNEAPPDKERRPPPSVRVYLSVDEARMLHQESQRSNISVTEVVRRLIRDKFNKESKPCPGSQSSSSTSTASSTATPAGGSAPM